MSLIKLHEIWQHEVELMFLQLLIVLSYKNSLEKPSSLAYRLKESPSNIQKS